MGNRAVITTEDKQMGVTSTGMAGAIASRRSLTTATSKGSAARIAIPTGGRVYAKSSAIFSGEA